MTKKNQPSEFGRWLIQARGERGLTQEGLSELCGYDDDGTPKVHVNTIKNIESGVTQKPTTRVVAQLRRALGDPPAAQSAREAMDEITDAFLKLTGAYLMRLPEEERRARVFELTLLILSRE